MQINGVHFRYTVNLYVLGMKKKNVIQETFSVYSDEILLITFCIWKSLKKLYSVGLCSCQEIRNFLITLCEL